MSKVGYFFVITALLVQQKQSKEHLVQTKLLRTLLYSRQAVTKNTTFKLHFYTVSCV